MSQRVIHYVTTSGIGNAWVANELRQLQLAGVPFALHAMRKPQGTYHASDWAAQIDRQTLSIYPLPPLAFLISIVVAPFLFGRRYFAALGNALFSRREHGRARRAALAHFFVACHWARAARRMRVSHIHSQWIHSCGTIAMYGAWLLGKPFSFTGHATDLFRDRVALRDKIARAKFIVCISNFHRDFYLKEGAAPEKLIVVYCGIDPQVFTPKPLEPVDGRPYRIRSSGRLVEKKGFDRLVEACAMLKQRGEAFECVIGGSGPLLEPLRRQIEAAGLSDRVTVTGTAIKQEDISSFMHEGDVYVLPCQWARDGDVDGLPQMLMEAMASGRPVISTRLVGIPDLVVHEETGLLVEPESSSELADAIARMRREPDLAGRLAESGCAFVHERFDIRTCLEALIERFRRSEPSATIQSGRGSTDDTDESPAVGDRGANA